MELHRRIYSSQNSIIKISTDDDEFLPSGAATIRIGDWYLKKIFLWASRNISHEFRNDNYSAYRVETYFSFLLFHWFHEKYLDDSFKLCNVYCNHKYRVNIQSIWTIKKNIKTIWWCWGWWLRPRHLKWLSLLLRSKIYIIVSSPSSVSSVSRGVTSSISSS